MISGGTGGALVPGGTGGAIGGGGNTGTFDGGPTRTCPTAGTSATPKTIAAMRAALSREWLLCSPLGLTRKAQEGIQITAGDATMPDRYVLLLRDAAGNVTPMHGADFEGTVDYLDLGDHIQVNFTADIGGTVISAPVVTSRPTMLIINNNGVDEYRYITIDEG